MPFEKELPAIRVVARKSYCWPPSLCLVMMKEAESLGVGSEGLGIEEGLIDSLSCLASQVVLRVETQENTGSLI